jgi:hypothetical protein
MRHAIVYGLCLALSVALGLAAAAALAEEASPAAPPAAPATPGAGAPEAAAPVPAAPASQGEAKPAESKPAETQAAAAASLEGQPPEAAPPESKPGEAKPLRPPARKTLTPEEIRQLPVFTRLDDASLREILEKGKALLGDVKDNTFGYDEEAFYWLLHLVSRLNPDLLRPDPEPLPYSALLATPSLYRGQPVTLGGVYRSYEKHHVPALALQKDVPYMYPCVISSIKQPLLIAMVIVLEDPSTYLRVDDDVVVKGYFYKVLRYQTRGGEERSGLVLVAQRLVPASETEAIEAPATGGRPTGGMFSNPGVLIALGILAVLMGAFFTVRMMVRKRKQNGTGKRFPEVHKFRLRRPDRIEPPAGGGPGDAGGGPKP